MTESSLEEKIEILTYSEVEEVSGFVGNFKVKIRKKARHVDMSKCTGCGECIQKCPTKVPSEFDMGLGKRKAIYTPFLSAVPNVPVIDTEHCIYFTKGKCKLCEKVCPTNAIDFEMQDEIVEQEYGAIVVATGFNLWDYSAYGEYGAGKYANVISGLHFERLTDTSGPTQGHVIRPSDGKPAKDVVFIQCVGSRDESKGYPYCSRICCMYTAKHALLLKDHVPDAQAYVFYIDVRSGGKNYEEFVKRVQRDYGAIYIRGRVSKVVEQGDKLLVYGVDTLSGQPVKVEADLVVLASAIEPQPDAKKMAQMLSMPCDQYGFFTEAHPKLRPVESVTSGVFLAGACQSPRDIPDTVSASAGAASGVIGILSKDELITEAKIAEVFEDLCTGCFNCIDVCPFGAIERAEYQGKPVARVVASICHGCGNFASACRTKSIQIRGFTDDQIYAQIEAAVEELEEELRLEDSTA